MHGVSVKLDSVKERIDFFFIIFFEVRIVDIIPSKLFRPSREEGGFYQIAVSVIPCLVAMPAGELPGFHFASYDAQAIITRAMMKQRGFSFWLIPYGRVWLGVNTFEGDHLDFGVHFGQIGGPTEVGVSRNPFVEFRECVGMIDDDPQPVKHHARLVTVAKLDVVNRGQPWFAGSVSIF